MVCPLTTNVETVVIAVILPAGQGLLLSLLQRQTPVYTAMPLVLEEYLQNIKTVTVLQEIRPENEPSRLFYVD
jgi:hypothetical protein